MSSVFGRAMSVVCDAPRRAMADVFGCLAVFCRDILRADLLICFAALIRRRGRCSTRLFAVVFLFPLTFTFLEVVFFLALAFERYMVIPPFYL